MESNVFYQTYVTRCTCTASALLMFSALMKIYASWDFHFTKLVFKVNQVCENNAFRIYGFATITIRSCMYRVFKQQVIFLKCLQIGPRWTKMLKIFFSNIEKTQNFWPMHSTRWRAFWTLVKAESLSIRTINYIVLM